MHVYEQYRQRSHVVYSQVRLYDGCMYLIGLRSWVRLHVLQPEEKLRCIADALGRSAFLIGQSVPNQAVGDDTASCVDQ